jgi:hypothetical protein
MKCLDVILFKEVPEIFFFFRILMTLVWLGMSDNKNSEHVKNNSAISVIKTAIEKSEHLKKNLCDEIGVCVLSNMYVNEQQCKTSGDNMFCS